MKLYPETKALIITLFLFFVSLFLLKYTKAYFSDTEKLLGNSIEVGVWNTTPSPIEPTDTLTPTPTPTEVPPEEPTITPSLTPTPTPNSSALPWINEIHYDNASTDTNEGIEIAGPAGFDLSGWTVVFYSGADSHSYSTLNLTGSIPDQQSGYGTLWFTQDGIQNGAPDGLALVGPVNTVVQFLSYEGTFTATNGPANGMNSINIGVDEEPASSVGQSLQLQGSGNKYNDFTWTGPILSTYGAINSGQIFN